MTPQGAPISRGAAEADAAARGVGLTSPRSLVWVFRAWGLGFRVWGLGFGV